MKDRFLRIFGLTLTVCWHVTQLKAVVPGFQKGTGVFMSGSGHEGTVFLSNITSH